MPDLGHSDIKGMSRRSSDLGHSDIDPKSTPKMVKPFSVSSKKLYISKDDRTAHFVGHYQLKELDIDDSYKRKLMNEEMEAEMTKMDLLPDPLAEE